MRIGYIGLGRMGKPIAVNLVKAGLQVVVHNRSQGKVQELVALGAEAGTSPAQLAASVDVVMTCLVGAETVELVVNGPDGVLQTARPGLILVDNSTIGPDAARRMAEICAAKGVTYLDAPVSGTGAVAWRGELTIMVGGDKAAYDKVLPILQAPGKDIFHMGAVGAGNTTKILNNMLMNINLAGVMEMLVVASKLGVDLDSLYGAVCAGSGGSNQWARVTPSLLKREFVPSGLIAGFARGDGSLGQLIEKSGAPIPMWTQARKLWEEAEAAGMGEEAYTAAIKILERKAGVEVRGKDVPKE